MPKRSLAAAAEAVETEAVAAETICGTRLAQSIPNSFNSSRA